jgi:hypothetical protein
MRSGSGGHPAPSTPEPPEPAAGTLRWAIVVLTAETVALAALVAFLLYADLTAPADNVRGAVGVTLYPAVIAAVLGFLTLSLHRRRAWARGPAVVLNLLMLPIGYSLTVGGLPWLGLPVMAVGVCGAGLLVAPSTRAALLSR